MAKGPIEYRNPGRTRAVKPAPYPDYSHAMTVMEPRPGHVPLATPPATTPAALPAAPTTGPPGAAAPGGPLRLLTATARRLDLVTRGTCMALAGLLVVLELAVVLLRYGFDTGRLQLQDLAAYAFAALVLLGLPVALAADRHVRVDVLRERQGPRTRRAWDAAGTLLLLVPAFTLTAWYAWPDVAFAWSIREGARETGGLGGVWLLKSLVLVSCALMLVQGLASLARPRADDVQRP